MGCASSTPAVAGDTPSSAQPPPHAIAHATSPPAGASAAAPAAPAGGLHAAVLRAKQDPDEAYGLVEQLLLEGGTDVNAGNALGSTPLHLASQLGLDFLVSLLLQHGASAAAADSEGATPLHICAQRLHLDAARLLLEAQPPADPNAHDASGETPLALAVQELCVVGGAETLGMVELLLRHGGDVMASTAVLEAGGTILHVLALNGAAGGIAAAVAHGGGVDLSARDGAANTPLHLAAQGGHLEAVQQLLGAGGTALLAPTNRLGRTPLLLAQAGGHAHVIECLSNYTLLHAASTGDVDGLSSVLASADLSACDGSEFYDSALHLAARHGHSAALESLLSCSGSRPDAPNGDGSTPLHLAVEAAHLEAVQTLINGGAQVDARDSYGRTPLHLAAVIAGEAVPERNQAIVELLLSRGARVGAADSEGATPLHRAAFWGNRAMAQRLVDCGADMRAPDGAGRSALDIARERQPEVCALLLAGWLLSAAESGNVFGVGEALGAGADVDARAPGSGDTALVAAAREGQADVVARLLDGHARLGVANSRGDTALHAAARAGQAKALRLALRARGAQADLQNEDGDPPLHLAAREGHAAAIVALLDAGARPDERSATGLTALHEAACRGELEPVRALLARGADANARDAYCGNTPLHMVAQWVMPEAGCAVAQLLGEGGADALIRNDDWLTALELARNSISMGSGRSSEWHRLVHTLEELEGGRAGGAAVAGGAAASALPARPSAPAQGERSQRRYPSIYHAVDAAAGDGTGPSGAQSGGAPPPPALPHTPDLRSPMPQPSSAHSSLSDAAPAAAAAAATTTAAVGAALAAGAIALGAVVAHAAPAVLLAVPNAAPPPPASPFAATGAAAAPPGHIPQSPFAPLSAPGPPPRVPQSPFVAMGQAAPPLASSLRPPPPPPPVAAAHAPLPAHPSASGDDDGSFEIQSSELKTAQHIARGSFGAVTKAIWLGRGGNAQVAVKKLLEGAAADSLGGGLGATREPAAVSRELQAAMRREVRVMKDFRHERVQNVLGFCLDFEGFPAIVSQLYAMGGLNDVLKKARTSPSLAAKLTWRQRLSMAHNIASGMSYLQGRGIIHRDLKSPNCFVNSHLEVCVGDFGTTKLASEARDGSASSQGPGGANNPRWLAPEVRLGGVATPASDVYSYGMTLYELLVWDVPWPKEKAWTIGNMLSNGARPPVPAREALPGPDTASFAQLPAFIKLMERCWADDQAARPPFADIMATLEKLMAEHESATGEGEQAGTSGAAAPAAAGLGPIKWRTPQPAARPPAPPQQSSHWDF